MNLLGADLGRVAPNLPSGNFRRCGRKWTGSNKLLAPGVYREIQPFKGSRAKEQQIALFGKHHLIDGKKFVQVNDGKANTASDLLTGRPLYYSDLNRLYEGIGEDWFYIDLNLEKYFDLGFGRLVAAVEVQNLLDIKNSQIVNPVTGRAYEYGDPTPSSYNDPLYPQLTGSVSPYPYDPSRYKEPRTIRFSLAFRF